MLTTWKPTYQQFRRQLITTTCFSRVMGRFQLGCGTPVTHYGRIATQIFESGQSHDVGSLAGAYVRFGSQADLCGAKANVRFTPNSDCESDFSQKSMSALTPKQTCAAQSGMSAKGQKQICIEGKPGLSKSKEPGRLAGLLLMCQLKANQS